MASNRPGAPNSTFSALRFILFDSPRQSVCAVVDPDACSQILPMIEQHKAAAVGLLPAPYNSGVNSRSPQLVLLEPFSPFSDWLLSGWGRSWGIYAVSHAPLAALREHFRSLLMVLDPAGNPLFFRFYDPRVFGVYLPTVNEQEAETVFGPVESFLFEEEDTQTILRFSRKKRLLKAERFDPSSPMAPQPAVLNTQDSGLSTQH